MVEWELAIFLIVLVSIVVFVVTLWLAQPKREAPQPLSERQQTLIDGQNKLLDGYEKLSEGDRLRLRQLSNNFRLSTITQKKLILNVARQFAPQEKKDADEATEW